MNLIKCIVVDDEPLARKGMLEHIAHVDFLKVTGVFEDAQQVYSVLNQLDVDLIFLDIEMPKISGIDLLRTLNKPPMVIITTAYQQYAMEGYELDVIDYLLKPVSLSRFLKAVNKANDIFASSKPNVNAIPENDDFFFVKENGKYTRILYRDVLFAEAMQNYVSIHLPDRKVITYITMSILERQFPAAMFLRIHKSYIVSLARIDSIQGNVVIINNIPIPVSRSMKDLLLQKVVEKKLLRR